MASDPVNVERLREAISNASELRKRPFELLREITLLLANATSSREELIAQDLILRLHENREALDPFSEILDGLTRQVGLFPYLDSTKLGERDQLAMEFHRPVGADLDGVVFHRVQAAVYRELLAGKSVVLSAPTSFGKSLIVDALVASGRYKNIVIVVPTIALIDETRRRLSKFGPAFKVITHSSQSQGSRNIFVMTQERVVDHPDLPSADLFVIDEFYKLQPDADSERSYLLNQAFYKLFKRGKQFYLLGPNIEAIPDGFPEKFNCIFIKTDYATVASDTYYVSAGKEPLVALASLCKQFAEPTLIYCASPARVRAAAKALMHDSTEAPLQRIKLASRWIGENYHSEWLVPRALLAGIGIHHGRLPRALAQFMVRAFNEGSLHTLVCTSTLIEGVNTKAKNVVIFDNKIARQKYDFFTFNNIRGRSGRMFEHFVGRVYLFHEPPQEELPFVDIPLLTQAESAPESLLIQLDQQDLSRNSRERVKAYENQNLLDFETLKRNSGVDPDRQIALAQAILEQPQKWWPQLSWTQWPTRSQLYSTCDLIWSHLMDAGRTSGISSGKQLAYKVGRFSALHDVRTMILQEIENSESADVDDAVEAVLEFTRQWASYRFPRLLMALHNIQQDVFRRIDLAPGDFRAFATQIENHFEEPALIALEEYGLPLPISRKFAKTFIADGSLDNAINCLRALDITQLDLSIFEKEIVSDVQQFL